MDVIKGRSEVDRYSLGHLCLITSAPPVSGDKVRARVLGKLGTGHCAVP